jgi:hypothetical protein
MAVRVVEALNESRSIISSGERLAGDDQRVEVALERAVIAQPRQRVEIGPRRHGDVRLGVLKSDRRLAGEELAQLELRFAEVGLGTAHPGQVEAAYDFSVHAQRDDDDVLRDAAGAASPISFGRDLRLPGCPVLRRGRMTPASSAPSSAPASTTVGDVVGADGVAAADRPSS